MSVEDADALQEIIERAKDWPIWSADAMGQAGSMMANTFAQAGQYGQSLRDLALWVAMRESDRTRIKQLIKWDTDREYRVDPLPERIAGAYQDLLYGEDPEFKAADPADQENLEEMVEANDLPSELRRWVGESVSEGEVWWRVFVDRNVSEWPIVDSSSRLDVVPYFVGRRIAAAAFVEDILTQQIELESQVQTEVYRHIEIQTEGLVRNLLYKGSITGIGQQIPLTDLRVTQELPEEWSHNLPVMLAGRIPNKLGRDWRLGISEFQGVRDLLLDLNEAHTTMAENARLTSQARMLVPASALDEEGKFQASKNTIVAESLDDNLDGKGGPYTVLEYKFQAAPLLTHIDNLVNTILSRVGLAEQFVGGRGASASGGQAFTGTALRTRLIPTTLAAAGKGRFYDDSVPKILLAMQMVSSLPAEKLGTGQTWKAPKEKPSMVRSSILPEDQNEQTQRLVMAVQGEIMSIETAVREEHPDWEDERIEDEIQRIRADRATGAYFGDLDPDKDHELLPSDPEGGPGSAVPGPAGIGGSRQPGVTPVVDGQSPGKRPPAVLAGGPK